MNTTALDYAEKFGRLSVQLQIWQDIAAAFNAAETAEERQSARDRYDAAVKSISKDREAA